MWRITVWILASLSLGGVSAVWAQSSDLAEQYVARATAFRQAESFDSAAIYFRRAAELYEREGRWAEVLRCLNHSADCALKAGDDDQAWQQLQKAQSAASRVGEDHPEKALTSLLTGKYLHRQGRHQEALQYLQPALEALLAQSHPDTSRIIEAHHLLGWSYRNLARLGDALPHRQEALALASRFYGSDHAQTAQAHDLLGQLLWNKGDFQGALEHLLRAEQIYRQTYGAGHPQVASVSLVIGGVYATMGDLDRAGRSLQTAVTILEAQEQEGNRDRLLAYNNLAGVLFLKGDYRQARLYFQKAIDAARQVKVRPTQLAALYLNLGGTLIAMSDYEPALEYLYKALETVQSASQEVFLSLGDIYTNLGVAWLKLDSLDRALSYQQKALAARRRLLGEHHPAVGASLKNLGDVYLKQNYPRQALHYYRQALDNYVRAMGKDHLDVQRIRLSLGEAALRLGDTGEAERYCREAVAGIRRAVGDHHPDLAQTYNLMGEVAARRHGARDALPYYRRALAANVPSGTIIAGEELPDFSEVLSHEVLLETLQNWAKRLRAMARKSENVTLLKQALERYQSAVALLDYMRRSFLGEQSKLFAARRSIPLFEQAIRTALDLRNATGDPTFLDRALAISEAAKAATLWESIQNARATRFAGIPDSLLEREHQLMIDLSYYRTRIQAEELKSTGRDSLLLAESKSRFFDLKRQYERLVKRFEVEFPRYFDLKHRPREFDPEAFRCRLPSRRTLLEYFVGDSAIYLFVLRRDGLQVEVLPAVPDLRQKIIRLRRAISSNPGGDFATYISAAHDLYRVLLAPVAGAFQGTELTIIPDGPLNLLPFEALLTEEPTRPEEIDYQHLPYLLNRFAVSYAYSALLLEESARVPAAPPPNDFIAFAPVFADGPPTSSNATRLLEKNRARPTPLLSSKDEVLRIQSLFEAHYGWLERARQWFTGKKTQVYLQREATEENLKRVPLVDYRYVHLATHGFANVAAPDLSGLLWSDDSLSSEDGVLYLPEIYTLQFNAELVALSACESGVGRVARGEGLIGLTRGFFYAGARNLLVSLWAVNDFSTARMMETFYSELLNGEPKAVALRQAKLNLIHSGRETAQPYYWAAFVLIGQ